MINDLPPIETRKPLLCEICQRQITDLRPALLLMVGGGLLYTQMIVCVHCAKNKSLIEKEVSWFMKELNDEEEDEIYTIALKRVREELANNKELREEVRKEVRKELRDDFSIRAAVKSSLIKRMKKDSSFMYELREEVKNQERERLTIGIRLEIESHLFEDLRKAVTYREGNNIYSFSETAGNTTTVIIKEVVGSNITKSRFDLKGE